MNVEDIKKRLISQSKRDERWIKAAEYREANRAWLDLSSSIAIHILTKLREKKMTQKDLAEALNLSPQYVNKIVKGSENLTLETITKIEKVLNITLIEVPPFSSLQNYGIDTWLSDYPQIINLRTLKSEMNLSDKPDCVYDSQSLKIA